MATSQLEKEEEEEKEKWEEEYEIGQLQPTAVKYTMSVRKNGHICGKCSQIWPNVH